MFPPLHERFLHQIATIRMQYIEGVEHDLVLWMCSPVLQSLE